ncbi:hypothetical protein [Legionella sainthelensi]|uniref:hypothetical protein n=1 Tax=Legionella sainthelensi TaxID=28087 RepID=UPI000E206470|nr:hypothetical protein [Legionella sainthelensi]
MGIHTTGPAIPNVLIKHFSPLIKHYSEQSFINIVNHSIIQLLESLKTDYQGFENLMFSSPLTNDGLSKLKEYPQNKIVKLSKRQPELPKWLLTCSQKEYPNPLYFFSNQATKKQKVAIVSSDFSFTSKNYIGD